MQSFSLYFRILVFQVLIFHSILSFLFNFCVGGSAGRMFSVQVCDTPVSFYLSFLIKLMWLFSCIPVPVCDQVNCKSWKISEAIYVESWNYEIIMVSHLHDTFFINRCCLAYHETKWQVQQEEERRVECSTYWTLWRRFD